MSNTKSFTVNGNVVKFKLVKGAIKASNGNVMILPVVHGDLYICYQSVCVELGVWEWSGLDGGVPFYVTLCDNCIKQGDYIEVDEL